MVFQDANRVYLVLPSFTGFRLVPCGFFKDFNRVYLVLPSFTGFHLVPWTVPDPSRVLPSFTGFYRVDPSFACV